MTRDEVKQWHEEHPFAARDDAYMDGVLANIKKRWQERPSERFGQMIVNTTFLQLLFQLLDEDWCDE